MRSISTPATSSNFVVIVAHLLPLTKIPAMAVRFSTIHRWDFCRALYRSYYNNKIYVTRINFLLIVKKISFFDKFAQ